MERSEAAKPSKKDAAASKTKTSSTSKTKTKSKSKKAVEEDPAPEPVAEPEPVVAAKEPTPRDSVPGSFPGAFDELADIDEHEQPSKAEEAAAPPPPEQEAAELKELLSDPDAGSSQRPSTAKADGDVADDMPGSTSKKSAKKERARIDRSSGAASWALWGAAGASGPAPKKSSSKKESKSKDPAEPVVKKEKEREKDKDKEKPSGLSRSKSSATKKEKVSSLGAEVEKSSGSDKDKRASRPSKHSRGMSFPFMLSGPPPPPVRSKSTKRASASKPTSRRHSVELDDSGLLTPRESPDIPDKAARMMGVESSKRVKRSSSHKKKSGKAFIYVVRSTPIERKHEITNILLSVPRDPYSLDDDVEMLSPDDGLISPPGKSSKDPERRRSRKEVSRILNHLL